MSLPKELPDGQAGGKGSLGKKAALLQPGQSGMDGTRGKEPSTSGSPRLWARMTVTVQQKEQAEEVLWGTFCSFTLRSFIHPQQHVSCWLILSVFTILSLHTPAFIPQLYFHRALNG